MTQTVQHDDTLVLKPDCDIVASTVDALRKDWTASLQAGGAKTAIELGGVGMIDSMGLGLIISCYKTIQARGGSLALITDNEDFKQLFQAMRMDQYVEVRATL